MDVDMIVPQADEIPQEENGLKRRFVSMASFSVPPSSSSASSSSSNVVLGECDGDVDMVDAPECDDAELPLPPPSKKCRRVSSSDYRATKTSAGGVIGSSSASGHEVLGLPYTSSDAAAAEAVAPRRVSNYAADVNTDVAVSTTPTMEPKSWRVNNATEQRSTGSTIVGDRNAADSFHHQRKAAIITPSSSFLVGSTEKGRAEAVTVNVDDDESSSSQKSARFGERAVLEACLLAADKDENSTEDQGGTNAPRGEVQSSSPSSSFGTTRSGRKTSSSWSNKRFLIIFLSLLVFLEASLLIAEKIFNLPFDPTFALGNNKPIAHNSIYVPGAGFSGFWFTLGRLKSIPNPTDHTYYCYSAGCLGVVATLTGRTMEEMSDLAFGVQGLWQDGTIDRFDVTSRFVDGLVLLHHPDEEEDGSATTIEANENATTTDGGASASFHHPLNDVDVLSRINILTTTREVMGVKHAIRSPKNVHELKEMLVQTTWIPFATGGGLWYKDSQTGEHHMDGAFSATTHPKCTHHLGLPLMMDLFLNVLNVNLGLEKVEKYWNAGVELGV